MTWKERNRKKKIAKLKWLEAMAHGEINPSRRRVKYDIYLENEEDNDNFLDVRVYTSEDLYKSYNSKRGLANLARKIILESPCYYGDRIYLSNPKLKRVEIHKENLFVEITLDRKFVHCTRVYAEYVYECHDEDSDYEVSKRRSLFYYVDDTIEW